MTIPLPHGLPSTSSWQPVDFLRPRYRTTAAVAGVARLEVPQLADDELWMIYRAVASCSSINKTTLRLYEDVVDVGRYLSGTAAGNFDEADYPGGLQLAPATSLIAQWTGCVDGAVGTLALQGVRYRKA